MSTPESPASGMPDNLGQAKADEGKATNPAPRGAGSRSGKGKQEKKVEVDPRVLERITRWVAVFETRGAAILAGGIATTVEKTYPQFPLQENEAVGIKETTQFYIEMRSKDLLELMMKSPLFLRFFPEIMMGSLILMLVVPRAVATFEMKKAAREAAKAAQQPTPTEQSE